ncbi:MAG: DUF378 domain-containing protein [Chlamydiae bacterium]|nr:DUF378 domain-containing protein [Chlamydiota bacterium]
MKFIKFLVLLLLTIGGINWGLYGLFQYNLIQDFLGFNMMWAKFAYILIGLAGLFGIKMLVSKCCCACHKHDGDKCSK